MIEAEFIKKVEQYIGDETKNQIKNLVKSSIYASREDINGVNVTVINYPENFTPFILSGKSSEGKENDDYLKDTYGILEYYKLKRLNDGYYNVSVKKIVLKKSFLNLSLYLKIERERYYSLYLHWNYEDEINHANFLMETHEQKEVDDANAEDF